VSHEATRPRPLQDRVVIVTGASRRIAIGAAIARRAVADGASVLLHPVKDYSGANETYEGGEDMEMGGH